jgi:hypothetical protein
MEFQQEGMLESPMPARARRTRRRLAGGLGIMLMIALTLGVSAAAANSPSTAPAPVAGTMSITAGTGPVAGASAAEIAKLEAVFAKHRDCMREHGIDMPEPVLIPAGNGAQDGKALSATGSVSVTVSGGAPPPELDTEAFEAADAACSPILEAAGIKTFSASSLGDAALGTDLGAGGGVIGGGTVLGGVAGADDVAAMVAPIKTYAACMREHGVDVPDPVVDESAGTFTLKLDLDPTAPDFVAADAACSDGSGFSFAVPAAPAGH